jgi:hypothetical protein
MKKLMLLALVLAVLASTGIGTAVAQEEPLPDLEAAKTGPSVVVVGDPIIHTGVISNAGDTSVVIEPGEYYLRDEAVVRGNQDDEVSPGFSYIHNYERVPGEELPGGGRSCTGPNQVNLNHCLVHIFEMSNTSQNPITINAGGYTEVTSTYIMLSAGWVTNCIMADPENAIQESNEENNTSCVTTKVQPRSK